MMDLAQSDTHPMCIYIDEEKPRRFCTPNKKKFA